jgi:hypothetical protein
MNSGIAVVALSSLTAIVVAAITYFTTKSREREAEWRKVKLDQYKEYLTALAGMVGDLRSHENTARYATAYNTVELFASQEVIERLHYYQDLTKLPADKVPLDEHDRRLTQLMLAIRRDLKIRPADEKSLSFHLIKPRPRPPTSRRR